MSYTIIKLSNEPERKEQAAQWFHEKWEIPIQAYLESIEDSFTQKNSVPTVVFGNGRR